MNRQWINQNICAELLATYLRYIFFERRFCRMSVLRDKAEVQHEPILMGIRNTRMMSTTKYALRFI